MTLSEVADFISRVGFPIAVTIWLLWREDRYRTYLHEHEDRERDMMREMIEQYFKQGASRKRKSSKVR